MYCPRPIKTAKTAYDTTGTAPVVTTTPQAPRGTKTVNPPAPRVEDCAPSQSTVVTGPGAVNPPPPGGNSGTSTTNTEYIAGPAGRDGIGFFWRGAWGDGATYEKQDRNSDTIRLSDVVSNEGCTFICIQDHVSSPMTEPHHESFVGPTEWPDYWALVANRGETTLPEEEQDFLDSLMDNVFDWLKNASLSDLIAAGAAVAGVIWAGSEIIDSLTDDGTGDGNAGSLYNGTDSYVITSYVAPDLKEVLAAYCEAADIPYDVSALPDTPCEFTVGNQTGIRSILETLALTFQFDMVDTNGTLKFSPRVATVVKTIPIEDLGYVDNRNNLQPPYSVKRFQGTDLPKTMTLTYPAADLDYNTFTQTAEIFTYETGQDVKLSTPVTLEHEQAKEIVEVSLINAHLQRTQYRFVTSYKHIELEPSDVISLADVGLVRLRQLSEKSEGLIEFIAEDAGAEQAIEGSDLQTQVPPVSTNVPIEIGYSQALFIDPPNLNSTDVGVRMYAAVHGFDKPGWPGATVYVSENNGASYEQVGIVTQEATFGLVASVTPSADWRVWDEDTTISVTIKANDLTSASELDVLNGKNRCMIGQEVIGFRNAVLTGPKTYTLSGLLRGRQGTEQFVGTHVANELFVLLDSSLLRIDYADNDRFSTKKYKVVTIGSSLDKADAKDVQMISNNTLMWTPYNAKVLQVGSAFNISYKGRVRYDNDLKDFATTNNDVDWAGFGIAIMDGSTILKTYTTTNEQFVYSEALQIQDFGSVQSSLTVKIAQLSQKYGAGYPVTVNS